MRAVSLIIVQELLRKFSVSFRVTPLHVFSGIPVQYPTSFHKISQTLEVFLQWRLSPEAAHRFPRIPEWCSPQQSKPSSFLFLPIFFHNSNVFLWKTKPGHKPSWALDKKFPKAANIMQGKSFCNTEKYKHSYTSVLVPRTIVSGFCFDLEKTPISQCSCSRPHTGKITWFSGGCIIRKDFSLWDRKGLFKAGKGV